jgi:hypothetical protein
MASPGTHSRLIAATLALAIWALVLPAGYAADTRSIERAKAFLNPESRGRDVLGYLHMGADFLAYDYLRTTGVNDGRGAPLEGHFALFYRFKWKTTSDGYTDLAFLCNSAGNVYKVSVMDTDAILPPFFTANVTINVLGNALISMFNEKLTPDDRRQLRALVNDADAKGLLEFSLRVQQAFGR